MEVVFLQNDMTSYAPNGKPLAKEHSDGGREAAALSRLTAARLPGMYGTGLREDFPAP